MNQVGDTIEAWSSDHKRLMGGWVCVQSMAVPDDPHGKWIWHGTEIHIDTNGSVALPLPT